MIKKLINKFNLEDDIKLITPIDDIKLSLNSEKFHNIINKYKSKDPIEKYILDLLNRKESNVTDLLCDNYFNNTLLNISFIINNPFTIDNKIFDIVHKNRELIKKVPDNITDSYEYITQKKKSDLLTKKENETLYKYYDYETIKRWYKTVIIEKLNKKEYYKLSKLNNDQKEKKWKKYNEIYEIYNEACLKLKKYIKELLKYYKPLKFKSLGCSVFGKNYYEYCLESFLGIEINILKLEKWAFNELERLIENMKLLISIELNEKLEKNTNFKNLLNKIFNAESQKFKSKKDLINYYNNAINKYQKIYVDILKFPSFQTPNLVIFNNDKMSGGYYYMNNFYLNTYNWQYMRKYTVESLVLHETIPGHHTQVHTTFYKNNKYNLLFGYFGAPCTGFIEGWGLFSEKLGFEQTNWDKIGQLEYEIFRTLRIIVDIGIHYHGK